jgi:DNA helicase-2/ATP-dependent DNA helicase PcrA
METPLQQYNAAFLDALKQLNPAQKRAVDQTEGPVLVIAGPGTGKTHVLATRIGKILLDTDARAQNILCLTFTDAGARAMRERLLSIIGPEAHRVPVFTFHAFCNRVIQENLELFGRGDLEPLSDLERVETIRPLLEALPTDHLLRTGRKQAFFFEKHLKDLFSLMKKEGWTPGFVLRRVDEFLASLPTHPEYVYQTNSKYGKKGDPKTAKVQDITEKMTRLKAAADLYPRYQQALQRSGRYEYEDMMLWVLKAFETNEALLRNYQERYQYFLVDEYQDTNGAQNQLLHHLLDFWEAPNVFIVGDDDQSIYEFQGARLANLLEFYHKYQPALQTVLLETNYRSTQEILDAASNVIENNALRAIRALGETFTQKKLQAFTEAKNGASIKVYESRLHEMASIVVEISQLLHDGIDPKEIAVLYARHKEAERLMQLLDKKGIAYTTKRPVNLLDLPIMQQFRELLRYLNDESYTPFSGDHRLFRLLHAPWWGLDPLELAHLAIQMRQSEEPGSGVRRDTFFRDFGKNVTIGTANAPFSDAKAVIKALNQWIADSLTVSLPALIEQLYRQSGLLQWALDQPDKVWYLQVLHTFLDFVGKEIARNPRFTLDRLLRLLESMDDNTLPLPLQQQVGAGMGIQLLTAHAAKGLEFEHVFLINCTTEDWEPSARQGSNRFALPETLTLSGEEDAVEARRRLFYVAMTRAKRHLHLSYSQADWNGKALSQVGFVDESGLSKLFMVADSAILAETQRDLLLEPVKPVITLPEKAVLDELLKGYTLSITALNRYLRCPIAFYYADLLRVPEAMREAAAYGQAMHETLRHYFLRMKSDPKQEFPGAMAIQTLFEQQMERMRGYFSQHGYLQRLNLGKQHLNRYALEQVPYWRKRAVVERRIDRVELDGVPLTGVLDKIEWQDNHLWVVDYKTGTPDSKKVAAPNTTEPLGGEFWRQLVFYKILLEEARIYPEQVGGSVIAWLEPDKKGNFVQSEVAISGEQVFWMQQLIKETYQKIQDHAFTEGCGKEDCVWCKMHRDRDMQVTPLGEEDGLDDA